MIDTASTHLEFERYVPRSVEAAEILTKEQAIEAILLVHPMDARSAALAPIVHEAHPSGDDAVGWMRSIYVHRYSADYEVETIVSKGDFIRKDGCHYKISRPWDHHRHWEQAGNEVDVTVALDKVAKKMRSDFFDRLKRYGEEIRSGNMTVDTACRLEGVTALAWQSIHITPEETEYLKG